ncbi:glycosyltransferase, partial [Methylobacterium radiotolerans]|uniref:glycosyltransferase n=1 Tax=Methylobacterium radiotolerans TaxID=31998 RepID=UPI002477CDEB
MTTGPNVGAADLDAPAAVRVVAAASHDALMARADLVVCQGGHGTVSRALLHGVPLLVIPLARDQADNAARCAPRGPERTTGVPGHRVQNILDLLSRPTPDTPPPNHPPRP